jgi:hypothetical protein
MPNNKTLQELRDELATLEGGKSHLYACTHCRALRYHLRGALELNENQLRAIEAHLLAQIALRRAISPF